MVVKEARVTNFFSNSENFSDELLTHHIPALFLLVLFTRGGRKSGESPGFDFNLEKNSDPSLSRRATAEREEGERKAAEASSSGGEA